MNDRHRTIARYNKKHRKKEKFSFPVVNLDKLGKAVANAAACIRSIITQFAVEAVKTMDTFTREIKTMPEERFQQVLLEIPQLTPEQIELLKKIRRDGNNGQPNNPLSADMIKRT